MRAFLRANELGAVLREAGQERPGVPSLRPQRDRTALTVCYAGGLRVSELAGLRVGDFVHRRGRPAFLRIHVLKGRRARMAEFIITHRVEMRLVGWLARYRWALAQRYGLGQLEDESTYPLFPRIPFCVLSDGSPAAVSVRALQRAYKAACRHAGVGQWTTIHALRHLRATEIYRVTRDIMAVKCGLRHASARTSEPYIHRDPDLDLDLAGEIDIA